MDVKELMDAVRKKTKARMNEVEAKALLEEYDVPVVPEAAVADAQEAVAAAAAFGYPVVVKGLGAELAHKTEQGLVHLDLVGERDPTLRRAVLELLLQWDGCDAVINLGIVGRRQVLKGHQESVLKADPTYSPEFIKTIHRGFIKFEKDYIQQLIGLMEKYNKPVFGVSMLPDKKHQTVYSHKKHPIKGVFFPTPERAVGAFAKMVQYQKFRSRKR